MRNDHSIAGTTILQTTLEDADNTQFFIDGKTNPVVKVGRWTLRRFGVQHHRQSVASIFLNLLFLSWLLTDDGVDHRNVLTLCEATARSTKLRKKAILPERPLSVKRSAFAYYNLTLSESPSTNFYHRICLTINKKLCIISIF